MSAKLRFGTGERLNYRANAICRRTPTSYDRLMQLLNQETESRVMYGHIRHQRQLARIKVLRQGGR